MASQDDVDSVHAKIVVLQLQYARKLRQTVEQKSSAAAAEPVRPPGIPLSAYGMGGRVVAADVMRAGERGYGGPIEPVEGEEIPLPINTSQSTLDVTCLGIPQRRPDIRDIVGTKKALNARITRVLEKVLVMRSGFVYSDPRRPEDMTCYMIDDPLPGFPVSHHLRMTPIAMSRGTVQALDRLFADQPGKEAEPSPEGRCWVLRQGVRLRNYLYVGKPGDKPPLPFLIRNRRLLIDVIWGTPEGAPDDDLLRDGSAARIVLGDKDEADPLDETFTPEEFADTGTDEDFDADEAAGRSVFEGMELSRTKKAAGAPKNAAASAPPETPGESKAFAPNG